MAILFNVTNTSENRATLRMEHGGRWWCYGGYFFNVFYHSLVQTRRRRNSERGDENLLTCQHPEHQHSSQPCAGNGVKTCGSTRVSCFHQCHRGGANNMLWPLWSHLTWEWMLTVPVPTDKRQKPDVSGCSWVFLSSGKEVYDSLIWVLMLPVWKMLSLRNRHWLLVGDGTKTTVLSVELPCFVNLHARPTTKTKTPRYCFFKFTVVLSVMKSLHGENSVSWQST